MMCAPPSGVDGTQRLPAGRVLAFRIEGPLVRRTPAPTKTLRVAATAKRRSR
jgi:hypothetical protein